VKQNGLPVLVIVTLITGAIILAAGGGIGGALIGMVIIFALVGWFGLKGFLYIFVGGFISGLWAMFIGILKAINPMNEKW
jgi:hypothetical protein